MTGSIFAEKSEKPDDAALVESLGKTKTHWDDLIAHVESRAGVAPEWKHYGRKHGWQVKFTHRRRALLYLVPHEGSFLAGMALREAGVAALDDAGLPDDFVAEIRSAKPYMEGWPARVEVTGPGHVGMVKALLEIKLGT